MRLDLSFNHIKVIENLSFENFPSLSVLDLSNNKIDHLDIDVLHGLNQLKEINLSYNRLKNLDKNFFSRAENLEKIYLNFNPFHRDNLKLSLCDKVNYVSFKDKQENDIDSVMVASSSSSLTENKRSSQTSN